jgi:predicted dehydrogenase
VTFRWGVAGPGGIAERFANAMTLVPDGTISAVASRSIDRASAFADRFGVPVAFDRYDALCEDPNVDIVYVATPHSLHAAHAELFLSAGKHVLCEKPFALNAGQALRMTEVARANGVFLMEAMWTRFLPAYRTLASLLAAGRIGEPRLVEADFGFRMPVMADHRLFDPALGGGALLDLGIYPVQLCSLVLGPPDRVVADGTVGATGVDEQVAAVLHHPSGALGVVKAAIRTTLGCRARVSGSDGWIDLPVPMHCPTDLRVGSPSGTERIGVAFEGDGMRFQLEEVHRCLAAGELESRVMPLAASLEMMGTLDQIRAQLGVVYPDEEPSRRR